MQNYNFARSFVWQWMYEGRHSRPLHRDLQWSIVLFEWQDKIRVIKEREMKWAGHEARMGEEEECIRIWVEKYYRPLALPRKGLSFLPWGSGRLTSSPSLCSPGRRSGSCVDSRCVWLDQAPPLLRASPLHPPWEDREGIMVFPG
jgi:hypothetical protein